MMISVTGTWTADSLMISAVPLRTCSPDTPGSVRSEYVEIRWHHPSTVDPERNRRPGGYGEGIKGQLLRGCQRGFTLLEIMLVMVMLGLVTSAILPSLIPDDSGALMKKEARRLMMLTQVIQEQALLTGQDKGLQQTAEGYRFLTYQRGRWQPITGHRLLSPVELNKAIRLTLLPGESVWRETLALEADKGFRFKDSPTEEPGDGQVAYPDLFFWASGEISPAELQLTPASNPEQMLSVLIDESGTITLADEATDDDLR